MKTLRNPLATGSGLERHMFCRASAVLERAFDERGNEYSTYGIEAHAYLARIADGMDATSSLELVDERFREGCRAIILEDLKDVLGLTAELAMAYNPLTDTARVLGVGIDRQYEAAGVTPDEIPLSLDLVGLDNPNAPSVGIVADYKRGWSRRTPAARNWQMRGGALALSRVWDLDEVRVQLIHLREDAPAFRDRSVFKSADLAMFAAEARVRREIALADREEYERTGRRPDATQGSWCDYCPSYSVCPAKTGLVRAALTIDSGTIEESISRMSDAELADTYRKLEAMIEPLKRARGAIKGIAAPRPILLEELPNGDRMYLGMQTVVGNLKIEGAKARDVVRELLGEDAVDEVTKYSVTQKAIEEAAKKRPGKPRVKAIVEELKRRGAATKSTKHDVAIYPVRANAQLKAG